MKLALALLVLALHFLPAARAADAPNVAAAADLKFALTEIAEAHARAGGARVSLSFGSSGVFRRQIAQGAPFELSLSHTGFFPDAHRLRVVWVGMSGAVEQLGGLQRSVEDGLSSLGFPPEGRGFQSHLTLGRVRDLARPAEREELAKRVLATQVDEQARMLVRDVHLIRSDLRPSGAVYTTLALAPLG